jgi:ATP-dependent Clp protease ATP-binding subunit ClpC
VLESLHITLDDVRKQVAQIVGQGDEVATGQIPFTPRANKVLELSMREALSLGHNHIGTEHVLLAIARENDGVASRILLDLGADAEKIRNTVIETLGPHRVPVPPGVVTLGGGRTSYRPFWVPFARTVLVLGWLLFAAALAVGILIGWLIWG